MNSMVNQNYLGSSPSLKKKGPGGGALAYSMAI
jgi:hypothetical protein